MKISYKITKKVSVTTPLVPSSPPVFVDSQDEVIDFDQNIIEEEEISSRDVEFYSDCPDELSHTENSDSEIVIMPNYRLQLAKRLGVTTLISTGTSLAMMPIFNYLVKNSKELGIDIHHDNVLFGLSTANTFVVTFFSSFSSVYHYIKEQQESQGHRPDSYSFILFKVGASCSVIMPVCLLWAIEVNNQKFSQSEGFDEFMAWATFTTIPLIINHSIDAIKTTNSLYNNDKNITAVNSVGSKVMIYGGSSLALIGTAIAYTEAVKALGIIMGIEETTSLAIGIALGGVLGASGTGLFQFNAMKSFFALQEEPLTAKKIVGGIISGLEGAWFSLPILSLGLKATEDWSPLIRGGYLSQLWYQAPYTGGTKLYDNLQEGYNTIYEGITDLCGVTEYYE